jgi:FAD/FMN-containing dehydrogenase
MTGKDSARTIISRRMLLGGLGGALVHTGLSGTIAQAAGIQTTNARTAALAGQIAGSVIERGAPTYELWRQSMIWQRRKSARYPEVIVQARSVADVVAAVNYAREHDLRVATRCGGHSMSASFLRDRGMLIDVGQFCDIEVDERQKEVQIGPGVMARALSARLHRHGLAFPTAHCGMVPLAGFLLGGGLGLNGNGWGPLSVFNILEAEVVTADGRVVNASVTEHPDLFWALRGGGPGLCGVVTRLRLKTYPLPGAIVNNSLTFSIHELENVASALVEIGPRIDRHVELLGYIAPVPADLDRQAPGDDVNLAMYLNANAYSRNAAEARQMVLPLMQHPIARRALDRVVGREVTIENLYFEEELGFGQRRWIADNIFTNRLPEVAEVLRRRMPSSPAPGAAAVFLYKGSPDLPEASCSVVGDFYAAYYMMWDNPTEDAQMMEYIVDLYRELVPLGVGSSIVEMNQEGRSESLSTCYSQAAWKRLADVRRTWDPHGVFHDFYGQS